jgi:hypothetical protein
MPLLNGWVNPLKCPEIDVLPNLPDAERGGPPPSDRLLDYLYAPQVDRTPEAFVIRYQEISAGPDPLPVVPAEPTILDKLVWPLRHAKGSYALGSYLGSIALSGMVGEMVAVLLWDISKVALQGHPMSEAEQRAVFGSTFERLGQERRVDVLHTLKLIDEPTKRAFDSLRGIRRKYLHFLSQAHENVAPDARRAYEDALKVVAAVLGVTFKQGATVFRPELMAYLVEKGIVEGEKTEGDA